MDEILYEDNLQLETSNDDYNLIGNSESEFSAAVA